MALPLSRRLVKECFRWRQCQDVLSTVGPSRRHSTASVVPSECPFRQTPAENEITPPKAQNYKAFEDIPTPKSLPLVGTFLYVRNNGGAAKIHDYCHKRHQELGPIFRVKLGPVETVAVSQNDLIHQVYASDGDYPVHFLPEAWVVYNEMKGIKRGLFFMDGKEWNIRRKLLNPHFLVIKDIRKNFGQSFNEIVTDTLINWDALCMDNHNILPKLEDELYKWSIESIGIMILGKRLGCVPKLLESIGNHVFVSCIQQVFVETVSLTMLPARLAYKLKLPQWRRFEKAATKAIDTTRTYVHELIKNMEKFPEEVSELQQNAILPSLLANNEIPREEVVNIIADLVLAAADTTSHAAQWALYLLAKNPHCQERLLAEINSVVSPGGSISEKHADSIPYCASIIKETLRLYPVASFLTRILPNDIVLGGYKVPAGKLISMSLYTVGRDPATFEDPDRFMPERWLRHKDKPSETKGHACIPFGMGVRSCIGRRVAEEQMKLLLSRVVQNYHLEVKNESEIEIALRMVTTPSEPIRISFQRRSK